MKLTFVYVPTTDLPAALAFYRDTLGLEEAWREGEETVVFQLPDSDVQLMVSVDDGPGGTMATFTDPAGNSVSVLDQMGAA